jgi:hypothetical protein
MDAEAIRRIPLSRFDGDFWAWTGEKHGLYSVKSAYRMMAGDEHHREDYSQDRAACSGASNSWIWKKLWQSKVPPKVRVFWWRISNEFIPSKANLHRRHIKPPRGAESETTFHALIKCTYAHEFWRSLLDLTGVRLPVLYPATWTADLLDDIGCVLKRIGALFYAECGHCGVPGTAGRSMESLQFLLSVLSIGLWMSVSTDKSF